MALLVLKNICKSYGAIEALRDVSLEIQPGRVVGLVGDNGAGKTTLVKIVSGALNPTSGEIVLNGQLSTFNSVDTARAAGIEIVYQDLALCPNLNASANVFLGREITAGFWPFKLVNNRRMLSETQRLLGELKSDTRAGQVVSTMSGGQRQAVAIARTLLSEARLVILDEPTAAISVRQVAEVLNLIRALKSKGVSVFLISHRLPDIFEVCEQVLVLRRGEKVADASIEKFTPESLTGLITGAIDVL